MLNDEILLSLHRRNLIGIDIIVFLQIDTLEAEDGWPLYIRTSVRLNASPEKTFNGFKWNNFHETQTKIDPFYESASMIWEISKNSRIIRKVSHHIN